MSLSLAPASATWAAFGQSAPIASTSLPPLPPPSPFASSFYRFRGGGSSSSIANSGAGGGGNAAPAPFHYSSIGGGAAAFGPNFDLRMLEKGALLKSCVRQIKRTKNRKRHQPPSSSSQPPLPGNHRWRDAAADGGSGGGGFSSIFASSSGRQQHSLHEASSTGPMYHYEGNNRLGKLYCRSGFHLQIHNDGKVNGTRQENSRFGVLEFLSVAFGLVSIKGKDTNRYLCMNRRGRLYGSETHNEECIFMENMLENYYNTYTSCRYGNTRHSRRKWYVAINKRGRPRRGNHSKKKQKFTQFLVLYLDNQEYKWTMRKFVFSNRDSYFGINSFTQEWRQRQTAWERVRTMQQYRRSQQQKQQSPSRSSTSSTTIPEPSGGDNRRTNDKTSNVGRDRPGRARLRRWA